MFSILILGVRVSGFQLGLNTLHQTFENHVVSGWLPRMVRYV